MTAPPRAQPAEPVAITVRVPAMLADCTGGCREVSAAGRTLTELLQALRAEYPLLDMHLYGEDGRLRPHLLIYLDDENAAHLESLERPLRADDRLTILQNVSGG